LAKSLDGYIQTVVEIHEGIRGPEPLTKFLPAHDFSGPRQEQGENLQRLSTQLYFAPLPPQLLGLEVELEEPEAQDLGLPPVHGMPALAAHLAKE
jgi:hypothetical protein